MGDDCVEAVSEDTLPVLQVIRRKVLAVGDDFEEWLWVYASLKAHDKVIDILCRVERIFARSLLTTPPTRILECCK